MNVQADIEKLESQIRLLKIHYDMYFSGALPKQPLELKKDVEKLIKKYANSPLLNYAQRFHFNSLIGRFNTLNELWSKTLRELEEKGKSPVMIQKAGQTIRLREDEHVVASAVITDVPDIEKIRTLHSKYVEAKKDAGEKDVKVSLDSFAKQISKQAAMMREKTKCNSIEVKIIMKESKVLLTAKVLQEEI